MLLGVCAQIRIYQVSRPLFAQYPLYPHSPYINWPTLPVLLNHGSWEIPGRQPAQAKNAKKVREPSFAKGIHSFTLTRQWKIIDNAKLTKNCLGKPKYVAKFSQQFCEVTHTAGRKITKPIQKHLTRHKMNYFCGNSPLSRKLYMPGSAWLT